jgi:hypothetical protein
MAQCMGCTGEKKLRKYNSSSQEYIKQTSVVVERPCNGVSVKNAGTTMVFFNGEPLVPGESKSVGGNQDEEYVGRIDLIFGNTAVPPATVATNSAWVSQKFFVDKTFVG